MERRKTINKRQVGAAYERLAAEYLSGQGYQILEMNYRCRIGEIDIIAKNENYLVFVEVKYRDSSTWGNPEDAVDYRKQKVISKVAMYYHMTHGYAQDTPCRFDVVAVTGDKLRLTRNAFEYRK